MSMSARDHLRVCGADSFGVDADNVNKGSPPRVRSRPWRCLRLAPSPRITSACAEQTGVSNRKALLVRDHLRVCGADDHGFAMMADGAGSPPRVRSRLAQWLVHHTASGITSACAEQTWLGASDCSYPKDHLRVCGADVRCLLHRLRHVGSPPRVRSRRPAEHPRIRPQRITSACAEQTASPEA